MEPIIEAGVQSYYQKSLVPLQRVAAKEILNHLFEVFLRIATEIDDRKTPDTRCCTLESYNNSSARQKGFLDGVLRRLNKAHDGLEVFDILVKWGVMSKHENLAIWKEELQVRKMFDVEVESAALELLKEVSGKSFHKTGRKDLTSMVSFAIDKASTRDVDDAISYNRRKQTVLVHIANPTEYVNNDKHHILMTEASKRLLTIYSRQHKLPMFPEEVSRKLFSLRNARKEARYATTFEFQISTKGDITSSSMQVYLSIISAPVCLSYREASILLNTPAHRYYRVLNMLYSLARRRREWRFSIAGARRSENNINDKEENAHLLVDELMISANTVAARMARRFKMPVLYRGVAVKRGQGSSKASTFLGTRYTCSMYGTGTKGRDMEKGANVKLNVWPMPHRNLGVEEYGQATCPIRKFSDLIVHFQFNAILRKQPLPFGAKQLTGLKESILRTERAAGRIDRRAKKYWLYSQLRIYGEKLHQGVLKKKAEEIRKRNRKFIEEGGKEQSLRNMRRETEWVVLLPQLKCEITVLVPFHGKAGMEVYVKVKDVNPRTSYILAYATKTN